MNISTDHSEDQPFNNKPSGGYEWWYFDAISEDREWSFVVIFYIGNPFSPKYIRDINRKSSKPDDYPAVSISVYNNTKTEFYGFEEYESADLEWDELGTLKIGANTFTKKVNDNELVYELHIDQQLASSHSVKGNLTFKSNKSNPSLIVNTTEGVEKHFWNLVQPKAMVEGSLKIIGKRGEHHVQFKGSGYHDHNVGLEPMKDDFIDWYWGRLHFKDSTLIYYVMNRKNEKQYQAWLISKDNQEVIDRFDAVDIEDIRSSIFGIRSGRKIILRSQHSVVTLQASSILDSGPFYQRFYTKGILKRKDKLDVAEGITEYIYPENIYNKLFWPAVKMRLRFTSQKPHWVQKIKSLYEWTW